MQVYHGSNVIVRHPLILTNGYYKDFGYAFYCTKFVRQAERWAVSRRGSSILNIFEYSPDHALNMVRFDSMTEEWLEMIVNCRRGIEHGLDIVEGPMTDDTIWDYIEDYVSGHITKAAFWELVKFRYPTHQIAFCTQRALATLQFIRSDVL